MRSHYLQQLSELEDLIGKMGGLIVGGFDEVAHSLTQPGANILHLLRRKCLRHMLSPSAIPFPENLNRRAPAVEHHVINIEINRLLIYIYFAITQYPHTYVSASLNYIQSQNHFLLFSFLLSLCRLYAQFCNSSFVHIIAQRKIEVKRLVRFFLRDG